MASYVDSVLGSGEVVKYRARISVWCMLPYVIVGFFLLPIFGFGLIIWITAFIRYKTTELAITDKKIIAKFGFIRRDTIEILLSKIESIQVKQSIFGRIFDYGSIIVSGAGNPQAPVPGIDNPIKFRKIFMEVQEKSTSTGRQQASPPPLVEPTPPPKPPIQPRSQSTDVDWFEKAKEQLSAGDLKEAVFSCTRAIEENAGGNEYYLRAVAYSKMKDHQRMRADIEEAARLGHQKAIETMEKLIAKS